jgi:hypothetical protein
MDLKAQSSYVVKADEGLASQRRASICVLNVLPSGFITFELGGRKKIVLLDFRTCCVEVSVPVAPRYR